MVKTTLDESKSEVNSYTYINGNKVQLSKNILWVRSPAISDKGYVYHKRYLRAMNSAEKKRVMVKGKKGWKSESVRHSLARKGIKTGRKNKKDLYVVTGVVNQKRTVITKPSSKSISQTRKKNIYKQYKSAIPKYKWFKNLKVEKR